ncbi:assimilatory sulfite reductase (NADPH) hemoprotein subunit [Blochmannia endosymbiont of Camponotus (Colobopsis) obliquus]|uniref:assimilatory sulfite reductase (NADPH) hemoprotein subunit n=1 Tax=Blochmannia endosymbiont of Camponotus (Colobopsis) obliquus TaxID=1505597 RepID=UPI00061A8684|nr:assimilatory sulfite reductase (NADPH) hemoprotein subunit [Blochmannia endosymbiont of Camponotus (Colobopsis) obliquus]AKC60334.1 sulfite reductase (NADPH) hemoprotein beta-component [Blochmannia endosymbiont of Camponotus (Colobopsis) obliquus]
MNSQKFKVVSLLSDHERLKRESNFLRGTIVQDLEDKLTGGFNGDNVQLIRFHGMYQQDDRDLRAERMEQKLEPLINIMLRCRLPGGIITPNQWVGIDNFSKQHTLYGSIRLTTRQTFQLHGILKPKLKNIHKLLHELGLDSIATAGDVNRNVLCTSNPMESELHSQVWLCAKKISAHLLPKSNAYAEIWLDGKKTEYTEQEIILGSTYLPRKFKISLAIPPQNDVDVHANDLNFIAINNENGRLIGFNVLVGGGLAMTYGDTSTYPRKASEFGYIIKDDILKIVEAVVTVQRDWGDRVNRKNAKTKYTLDRVGVNKFKKEVEDRSGVKFVPIVPYVFSERGDRFGWIKGMHGLWHFTVFIENGRILDYPDKLLKTGLAKIADVHKGVFRLTANQNLIISDVREEDKGIIEFLMRKYGVIGDNITLQRKSSMACVSFPTCPLAMAEAERFLPQFVTKVEHIMLKYGLANDSIILRITGCPNGCGRAMLSEIGLVGKALGRYNLYLGGDYTGTRIPRMYMENITEDQILKILDDTIGRWSRERYERESYGDYVIRAKIIKPVLNSVEDFYVSD